MIKDIELVRENMIFPALMDGAGEPVLLLHGFPDCHHNWVGQIDALAHAGYLAVAPALRGYAPTCLAADGDYSLRAAVDDACAFAGQLGGRVHVVGHDWGAVVAWLAAARSPELFSTCTALAIPPLKRLPAAVLKVPRQLLLSSYMELFQLPLVAEWWCRRNDFAGIETLWRRWSPGWEPGEFLDQAKQTLGAPGVLSAALSWYRHLPRVWQDAHREARGWMGRPVEVPALNLFGENDGCMTPALLAHTVNPDEFPAGLRVETIADAGHFLHLEQPAEVNRVLLEHLGKVR